MADTSSRTIGSFAELHAAIEAFGDQIVVFRGVRQASYTLLPKVGRYDKFSAANIERHERAMLRSFKQEAHPFLNYTPSDDWEWLALAQHHGLPTRLMDWTRNPLVAAYFAVENEHDGDSLVYAYINSEFIITTKVPEPFAVRRIVRFIPNHITPRITAQAGLFTIHPSPKRPFNAPDIIKLVIKKDFRKRLKNILQKYGVHRATLFPGLDGVAKHIEWETTGAY